MILPLDPLESPVNASVTAPSMTPYPAFNLYFQTASPGYPFECL